MILRFPDAPWWGGSSPGADRHTVDGDHTVPSECGAPEISFPFEGDSFDSQATYALVRVVGTQDDFKLIEPPPAAHACEECFLLEQKFEVAADFFEKLPLNTLYDRNSFAPDYAGNLPLEEAILVHESAPRDKGNGIVEWVRTYCYMKFESGFYVVNDYESVPFTLPAFAADDPLPFSPEITEELPCRVERKFFIFDGNNIPERYEVFTPFLKSLGPSYPTGNILNNLAGDDPPAYESTPNTADYLQYVDQLTEIVARATCLRRFRGNIFELVTSYVFAQ